MQTLNGLTRAPTRDHHLTNPTPYPLSHGVYKTLAVSDLDGCSGKAKNKKIKKKLKNKKTKKNKSLIVSRRDRMGQLTQLYATKGTILGSWRRFWKFPWATQKKSKNDRKKMFKKSGRGTKKMKQRIMNWIRNSCRTWTYFKRPWSIYIYIYKH